MNTQTSLLLIRSVIVVLVAGLAGGCAPAGDSGAAGGPGETSTTSTTSTRSTPSTPSPPGEPVARDEPSTPAVAAQRSPTGAVPVDADGADALVPVEDLDTRPAAIAAVRADPTLQGATDTALLYLAGWSHGINTGDSSLLTQLSTPECRYCAATVARLAADPRTTADGFTTRMTATVLGAEGPDTDHPYAVVGLGVQIDSARVTETDGIPVMQMLEPMTAGFRFAVARTESGWAVNGIANDEWDGTR